MEDGKRKPRRDALENHARLITAARDVLGKGGPGASLEAVARQAGLGVGTLYRHFPHREALFHAVYRADLEQVVAGAEALEAHDDPLEGLRAWLHANVAVVETKRGLLGALSVALTEDARASYADLSQRLRLAVDRLLNQGAARGKLRADVRADDLIETMYAFCYAHPPGPDWRQQVLRRLDIFVDGLRAQPSGR
ncbi:TetR family transcriptional regulator [Palleronia aestuarii]|uniref:TetR family transcriptional regulator n=1 Tax=Palleronia aestuarii TaxID=568105 RepID=A0A2W7NDU1_9RHOB|nr:TetR/AcrR family transcriptional regulator [Palleronia aestuarii]PZX17763.1 TetR family transcriptional regulator [Palleronia aestuarii]